MGFYMIAEESINERVLTGLIRRSFNNIRYIDHKLVRLDQLEICLNSRS